MVAIRLAGVSFAYPGAAPVLSSVSFSLEAGVCAGLIGPNGAGKSTLLLLLTGILQGDGDIEILGQRMERSRLSELRKHVGLVFQDPDDQLFMPTVLDDVAVGPLNRGLGPVDAEALARRALEQAGATHLVGRSPQHLSLGERKRVALAGIIAMEPRVLVLDEPTAGLDPRGRGEFIQLLQGLSATRLIATHDLDMVRQVCGHVIVLDGGKVIAEGAPDRLLDDRGLLERHGLAPMATRPASPA